MSGDERMRGDEGEDYLWDRSGPPDPQLARLERLLGGLAHADGPLREPRVPERTGRGGRRPRWRTAAALAAALAVCAIGVHAWVQQRLHWDAGEPWPVLAQAGEVRIPGDGPKAPTALAPEQLLETGAKASARLRVAGIGEVAIGEGSRVRLRETGTGRHRLQLLEGSLWARVWAPPGQFGIGVAGAEVIDLGCEFLLQVDATGNGTLRVLSGWVQVDNRHREVLVPEGTQVRVNGDGAAGTPHAFGASPAFVAALEAIDARAGAVPPDGDAVRRLLAAAGPRDALSLLTLLRDHPHLAEGPMFERLAGLLPTTPAATRAAWQADRMGVLNAWWDALPHPRVKRWWLQWPDALPARDGKMAAWLRDQAGG